MRIAEISTPELWQINREPEPVENQHPIISDLEIHIGHTEALTRDHKPVPETIPSALKQSLTRLSRLSPLPNNSLKLHVWKLSFRLWNACVDLSNAASLRSPSSSSSLSFAENVANLRHIASDMLSLAGDVSGIPSSAIKCGLFYHKTGVVWHDLKKLDLASACFERATEIVSKLDVSKISDSSERKFLLDLNLARARTAWETSDRNLAATLVNRAKIFLFGSPENYKTLANQFLAFGKSALSTEEANSLSEALRLMTEALDLSEKGLGVAKTREDTVEFKLMRCKILRFISAVHLQKGEYKSVIKCVKVLRSTGDVGEDQHASLPVLAMKAWLGMGRNSEAEEELRSMVGNKEIPEGVWVSAVEAYFEAVGTAGAETAKGVFLGLVGRCHVSAKAALRVTHRVLGDSSSGDQGSKVRAKVVAQLASDERVVALFAGETVVKERKAMHAVLWNCGSDHFRAKDYETSAEMYEKSLLYIPHDIENRVFRAKGFRVLCLCHLGLTQLDRAHEYIDEAEKLEPNITCAFLKFKILLQKNDHTSAVSQIEAMASCLDFTPDFLVLAGHEAVACEALPVAVASLSKLLNFFSSGKPMPTSEVVVLRTLITLLAQDNGKETEALNYMQHAHSQASKLGIECFFGVGEVGRREQNWFAVTSWNLGTKCGKEKKYELCSEFLKLSSEFYGFTSDKHVGENSVMVCKSLILSVTAVIASENEKHTLAEAEVKQAAALLDRAGKILTTISKRCGPAEDDANCFENELLFMYTINSYNLHGRLNNSETQQLLVKSFFESKACNPNYLLQIAMLASQTPNTNPEVAIFALNQCLSSFLSSSRPDYASVALLIRKLIAISSVHKGDADDEMVNNMYKQAYRIMVGLKEGEYPVEEGKWLAMTAWNRAALPIRLGQTETASKWMNVGLEIARKIPGMDTYTACMEDFVAGFGKKIAMQVDGVKCKP